MYFAHVLQLEIHVVGIIQVQTWYKYVRAPGCASPTHYCLSKIMIMSKPGSPSQIDLSDICVCGDCICCIVQK